MERTFLWTILLLSNFVLKINAQSEFYLSTNANLHIPIATPEKRIYPLLWYDNDTESKILVGGFGFGLFVRKHFGEKWTLKSHGDVSKHTYWDESVMQLDDSGAPVKPIVTNTSDFALGLSGILHYGFRPKWSIGAGLGTQIFMFSLTRQPNLGALSAGKDKFAVNRFYKTVVPMIPVEVAFQHKKKLFTLRYEQALLNRFKKELARYKSDNYGLLIFEIGFKM
jgi:hypothetical protein